MSAINNLPNELLVKIFKNLAKPDVKECELVSSRWFSAAYAQFVSEICLSGPSAIKEFMNAADATAESNLLAVRTLVLDNSADLACHSSGYQLGVDDVDRLFLRFPRLTNIRVKGDLTILKAFEDEELCRVLFDKFPWLSVQVGPEERYKAGELYKLRHLWTAFQVDKIDGLLWEFGSAAGFLVCAPHLKKLCGYNPDDFLEGELSPVFGLFANLAFE